MDGLQPFEVQREIGPAGLTLRPVGELDLLTSRQLEAAVAQVTESVRMAIVLDLGRLSFIDLRGLRAVLAARELCEQRGCSFSLRPGPRNVHRLFALVGIDDLPFAGPSPLPALSARAPALRGRGRARQSSSRQERTG